MNVENGFILFGSFKNIFIIKYNRTKRNREKIFGNKKTLVSLNSNINQIKLITLAQKSDEKACDYYDKENNIFYTDIESNIYNEVSKDGKSFSNNKSIYKINFMHFLVKVKLLISHKF